MGPSLSSEAKLQTNTDTMIFLILFTPYLYKDTWNHTWILVVLKVSTMLLDIEKYNDHMLQGCKKYCNLIVTNLIWPCPLHCSVYFEGNV